MFYTVCESRNLEVAAPAQTPGERDLLTRLCRLSTFHLAWAPYLL